MFPDSVLNVLVADNPWLEGEQPRAAAARHLPTRYIERHTRIKLGGRVVLIVGPRQAGKSTLAWKTLSTIAAPVLYLNCEEPALRDGLTSPSLFIQGLSELVPAGTVVFFEEVQHLQEAGLFLKGLVDRRAGYRWLATGSSSYDLEARTRESLAGRADRHLLLPLSLGEVTAGLRGAPALRRRRVEQAWRDLIVYGGFPSVHLAENKAATLTGLVEAFVLRDASDRFRIRHTSAFRKLLELMASQVGNLGNYAAWAAQVGVSADTARDYADMLVDAHVVKLLPPFVGGKRAEITSAPKVYFVDHGIRNRLFGGFAAVEGRPDKGALLENYVFTELAKSLNPLVDGLFFWRSKSKAEVDFVITRNRRLTAIEVKAGQTRGRLSRAAHSFIEAYQPERFWVVSDTAHPGFKEHRTEVRFTTPTDLGDITE